MFDSLNNVDAIKHVDCRHCGARAGKLCKSPAGVEVIQVHQPRLQTFFWWAKQTNFVPDHMIGKPDLPMEKARCFL